MRRWPWFALVLSCGKAPTMISDPPITAPPSDAHRQGAGAAGDAPQIALGPTFTAIAFAPGRYATAVQRTLQGTHDLQLLVEDSTASFILELAADGTATAYRGWRYNFTNDGPRVHTAERFRDQQGYRGRFVVTAGIASVELHADDSVCTPKRESTYELTRSAVVKLRCVRGAPQGHAEIVEPALICEWVDVPTGEPKPHLVAELAPDGWMVLGGGNGLRVKLTGRPIGARAGQPAKMIVNPAVAPL